MSRRFIIKFDQYHDKRGRFTFSPNGVSPDTHGHYAGEGALLHGHAADDPSWDQAAAEQFMNRSYSGWASGLGHAERAAVNYYVSGMGMAISKQLRGGQRPTGQDEQTMHALDSALAKARTPQAMTLYRGVSDRVWRLVERAEHGSLLIDPGYGSTTISHRIAKGWRTEIALVDPQYVSTLPPERRANFRGAPKDPKYTRQAVVQIHLPAGSHAAFLHPALNTANDRFYGHQQEVLMPRGAVYRVHVDGENRWLEYLGSDQTYTSQPGAAGRATELARV